MDKQNDRVVSVKPAERLRGYIRSYVFSSLSFSGGGEVFLPSRGPLLSLLKRTPLTAGPVGSRTRIDYKEPMLLGPLSSPVVFGEADERLDDITVVFTPVGGRCLLRAPMHELTSNAVDAGNLFPRQSLLLLAERVHEARTLHETRRRLDQFFSARIAHLRLDADPLREIEPSLAVALDYAHSLPDWELSAPARALAGAAGISERSLRRGFREVTGLTPKQYLSTVRLEQVIRMLSSVHADDLSAVALSCGYFDYAHFAHDFHMRTLTWPTQFVHSRRHRHHNHFV
ncbi:MAG: helix-turn-helix domain-containing protein [Spirochaetes bacterium]|jgi:AraC-like DNA-binding protein|nr:helix-turn-helix domain-containing protein [Spirochaetota bacterium]